MRRGAVEHDVDAGAGRQRGLERGQAFPHPVHHIDRIGVGLAQNREDQRPLAVAPGGDALVLHAVHHLGHLVQADGRLGAAADHEVAEGRRVLRLVVGAERELLPLPLEQPDRRVGVGLGDRLPHRVEGEAHGGDAVRVQPDPHGIELLAEGHHLRHARARATAPAR